jgi:hypothetical protein
MHILVYMLDIIQEMHLNTHISRIPFSTDLVGLVWVPWVNVRRWLGR